VRQCAFCYNKQAGELLIPLNKVEKAKMSKGKNIENKNIENENGTNVDR
jgi:hypothetical protein